MGRIIRLKKEGWVTRLWRGFVKWVRHPSQRGGGTITRLRVASSTQEPEPKMAEQLLASQRKVVDELRRLNQILARSSGGPKPARRHPGHEKKIRHLWPKLEPEGQS